MTGPAAAFAGGDGSANNPYQISNVDELQNIQNDLGANYVLINNIDASATSEWNDGAGFDPLSNYDYRFTGFVDGNNYTIYNLHINRPSSIYVGLFGFIRKDNGVLISDLRLENVNVSGSKYVGGLVGLNAQGEINNSYAAGNVTGNSNVGGLIGYNKGIINGSYATGNVNSSGDNAGGLVGYNHADENDATITDSYATGNVNSSGDNAGVLVGYNHADENDATIKDSYATGNVTSGGVNAGVLVGHNHADENDATIKDSYATGNVNSSGDNAGGLVGYNYAYRGVATITDSYATGNVNSSRHNAGGFVGFNHAYYPHSNRNVATITDSYATGNVNSSGHRGGGLVGYNYAEDGDAIIADSYATGNVTISRDYAGGLVGINNAGHYNCATITNSYATGNVIGHWYIGGLVGENNIGDVTNCYSIGHVDGNDYLGGLVGFNDYGAISDSYYNQETSGQSDTGKGIHKTTTEMKQQSIYTSWNFDDTWFIHTSINDGYPQLHNFISAYPAVADFTSNVTSGVIPPVSVKFTELSSNEPTQWFWDFGDGNTSTEQNPTHTYTNYGNYNVSLTAINDVDSDTETKMDYITIDENIIFMAKSIGFNDSSAVENSTLTIPLEILNVSKGPIQTIKCDIQYNESIMFLESIESGNLTSGWTVSKGINAHSITLTTSDNNLAIQNESTGNICNLTFSVIGKAGESTELKPWNVDLANTANLHGYSSSKTGIFTVETPGRLSGNVRYNFNGTNIENVDISLMQSGNLIAKNTTNTSGYYNFTNIEPGTYNIIFDKPGFYSEEISVQISAGSNISRDANMIITGDLDGNGIPADAVDVNMMMQASVENLESNRYFNLDDNGIPADAVDVNMMIQASVGDIVLE